MKNKLILPLFLFGSLLLTGCGSAQPGEPGIKGETGEVGDKGPVGDKGETGRDGLDGTTILNGTGKPSNSLGKKGDIYLDTENSDIYTKKETSWILVGNLKGETGAKGDLPEVTIGENGNWFINGIDSNVSSNTIKDATNDPNISDGFTYKYAYENGQYGLIIDNYSGDDEHIIMPNTIDNIPVIGYKKDIFVDKADRIISIKFSKNITKLVPFAGTFFELENLDFNDMKVEEIPREFSSSGMFNLTNVNLSKYTKVIGERAFYGCGISQIDFKNVETIKRSAFDNCHNPKISENPSFYIPKTVKNIDKSFRAFKSLYFEANIDEEGYNYVFNEEDQDLDIVYGAMKNNDFIYENISENEVIVHKYLKQNESLIIPSTIDGKTVVSTGKYSFSLSNPNVSYKFRDKWAYDYVELPETLTSIGEHSFENLTTAAAFVKSDKVTLHKTPSGSTFSRITILLYKGERSGLENYKSDHRILDGDEVTITPNKELLILENSTLGQYYNFVGFLKNVEVKHTIPEEFNSHPVSKISSYAVVQDETNVFIIPDSVNSVETLAIYADSYVYVSRNATFLPSNAIVTNNYYVNNMNVISEWDSNAVIKPNGETSFLHNQTKALKVDGPLLIEHNYIEETETSLVSLIDYFHPDTRTNNFDIKIPRQAFGLDVTTIQSSTFKFKEYNTYNIYIPRSITHISSFWIDMAQNVNVNIYFERTEIETSEINLEVDWLTMSQANFTLNYGVTLN